VKSNRFPVIGYRFPAIGLPSTEHLTPITYNLFSCFLRFISNISALIRIIKGECTMKRILLNLCLSLICLFLSTGTIMASDIFDAINSGDITNIKNVVEKNPEIINVKADYGYTPLQYAAFKGNKEVVKFLVSKGADLKAKDQFRVTVLHYAVLGGNKEIVEFFLAKGASINAKSEDGITPLYFACGFLKNLYRRVDLTIGMRTGIVGYEYYIPEEWMLSSPSYEGNKEIAELLLANGADVNVKDENRFTPLHYVSSKEIAELLISGGAHVNAIGKFDITPLHCAIFTYDREIIEFLILKGAHIDAKTAEGNTPLYYAVYDDNKEISEFLIAKGADVNVRNKYGRTLLAIAIEEDYGEIIELLRKAGAKE
jgi:ankyrin repeat protein